jgi:hypothetical protein
MIHWQKPSAVWLDVQENAAILIFADFAFKRFVKQQPYAARVALARLSGRAPYVYKPNESFARNLKYGNSELERLHVN